MEGHRVPATLSSGYSMWSHGGDNEISDMLRKTTRHLKFSTNICSIVEEGQISALFLMLPTPG